MGADIATLSIACDSTGIKNADRAMQDMGKTGQMLEGIMQKVVAAFGIYKMAEFVKESTLLSAQYETLGVVMKVMGNNAGYTGSQMTVFQTSLEKTGISMMSARQSLNMMAAAQLDLTKASTLGRVAQDAGVIGNINSSEAFQRLVMGIQTGQAIILHHMGIMVNFEEGYRRLAPTIGKTTATLTEHEKAQLRLQMVLEEGAKRAGVYVASMETAGKQLLSMQRYADDLQVVFGALFGDAMGVGVRALNSALLDTKKWLEANQDAASQFRFNLGLAAKEFIGLVTQHPDAGGGALGFLSDVIQKITIGIAVVRDIVDVIRGTLLITPSLILGVIEGLAEGITSALAQIFGMKPPEWFLGLTNWSKGAVKSNWDAMGNGIQATRTKTAYLRSSAGNPGSDAETGPLGMGLTNQELAKLGTGSSGVDNAAISERERLKAEKRHAAWLQFQGAEEAAERKQQHEWDWQDREDANAILFQQAQDAVDAYAYARNLALEKSDWEAQQAQAHRDAITESGRLEIEEYTRQYEELKQVETSAFGAMGATLDSWSQSSTNAIVDFCFTGKAAFSDLVTSMLKDMARLAIQKNVTGGLFDWIGKLITGGVGGYDGSGYGGASVGGNNYGAGGSSPWFKTYATGTDYVPQTGLALIHQGERIIPASQNKGASQTNNVSISVNVSSNGQATADAQTQGKSAVALGQMMKNAALQVIQEQQRSGGCLAGA